MKQVLHYVALNLNLLVHSITNNNILLEESKNVTPSIYFFYKFRRGHNDRHRIAP